MNVLVTGAKGFVGRNLVETLRCIRDGKMRGTGLQISRVHEFDKSNGFEELARFTADCDFVFHLAGVNRPRDDSEFYEGNCGLANALLSSLKENGNRCPVMLASSVQAALVGRFSDSEYGRSKLAAERLFFRYAKETGAKALIYRFPNLFGKWCRPNYNSAVATFCHAVANGETYTVNDRDVELELLYIDDLVDGMLAAMAGRESRCEYDGTNVRPDGVGRYCYVPTTHRATLGEIVDLLEGFREGEATLFFPPVPEGSFEKKMYSAYLSYLPEGKMAFDLAPSVDSRGSFTEFFKTGEHGQFSVNVSKAGVTKGCHWHHTKVEIFLVVSGHGLIRERRVGRDEDGRPYPVREFEVSGARPRCVYMLPGYTHSITNLSDTEDLVTVMWANEVFDAERPETYYEDVTVEEGPVACHENALVGEACHEGVAPVGTEGSHA